MAVLKDVKRIVVKVGTSTLTYSTGKTNIRRMHKLVSVLSDIVNSGIEVALVTSGAIGVDVGKLGLKEKPADTAGKQAAATIGQCELMFMYDKLFGEYGHTVGQLLITKSDVENDERRNNLINTYADALVNYEGYTKEVYFDDYFFAKDCDGFYLYVMIQGNTITYGYSEGKYF